MHYSTSEFETIYTRCFPPALRLAINLLHNEDEARDVVHEVFLRLWESDVIVENPPAFILSSVRNACLNHIRSIDIRDRIRKRLMIQPPPLTDDDYDPERQDEEIRIAVSKLTPRQQQIIHRIYTDGMSYNQTAESLGVSFSAVNKNMVAAFKKLRIILKNRKS